MLFFAIGYVLASFNFIEINFIINFTLLFIALLGVVLHNLSKNMRAYLRKCREYTAMEAVYSYNVKAIHRNLNWDMAAALIGAFPFLLFIIGCIALSIGETDNVGLGFISVLTAISLVPALLYLRKFPKYVVAKYRLLKNPTPQTCADIIQDQYLYDYITYYDMRSYISHSQTLIPKPRYANTYINLYLCVIVTTMIICVIYPLIYKIYDIYHSSKPIYPEHGFPHVMPREEQWEFFICTYLAWIIFPICLGVAELIKIFTTKKAIPNT